MLTQASLMVNESGVDEAVRIAQRNPGLVVGLHLTLCCGRGSGVSALTDRAGNLPGSPAGAGLRYAFHPALGKALDAEIEAQFRRFRELGFPAIYWDGHTHLHLHPTVLKHTLPFAGDFEVMRLVREKSGGMLPAIFRALSRAARPKLDQRGIAYVDRTFGLTETGRIDTRAMERFLVRAPKGWSEIYWHPGADPGFGYGIIEEMITVERIARLTSRDLAEARS